MTSGFPTFYNNIKSGFQHVAVTFNWKPADQKYNSNLE